MALVIAAAVFMGDLITALAYLLRGELTSRFLARSFVVLTLSGDVFFYYFGGLRKTDATPAKWRRDRIMAGLSSAVVALMIAIVGIILALGAVIGGFLMEKGQIVELTQPAEFPIIVGAGLTHCRSPIPCIP